MTYSIERGVDGVRLATKSDEDELFGLLIMLHSENAPFTMNRDKVRAEIRRATERRGGMIGVVDDGSRIVASLGMVIAQDWYSDDCYLHERWNFVHPEYRKSDYAKRLIRFGKWASDWFSAHGAPMPFFTGVQSLERTAAKVRLYARELPCIGAYFCYGRPTRPAMADSWDKAQSDCDNMKKREVPAVVREIIASSVKPAQQIAALTE